MRINEYLEIVEDAGKKVTRCLRCGYVLGPATENPKKLAKMKTFPVTRSGPMVNPWEKRDDVETREFYCPNCGVMFAVEIVKVDEPIFWETIRLPS